MLRQNGILREHVRPHALQMGLITVIFLLFLATVAGFVQFTGGGIQFRAVLTDPRTHALVLPAVMHTAQFHGLLIAGLTLCVVLPLLSPIRASLATLLASAVPLYLGIADTRGSLLLPMEFSLLALGVIFAVNVLIAYFRETHSRQQVLSLFGQFVPPQLVEQIARDPKRFSMEGEAKRVTIFFCDLQDFSGVAEQLNPRQLTLLLNEYFDAMTEVLHRHGATIDKYIGDCIMAFWGAPVPQEDHAQRAVLASFEMQKTIAWLREGYLRRGWPAPLMGIGINTGVVSVGNMGSRYRIAYTVIGDAVNLAARLEALTRTYHVPTLVSEATRADCKDVVFRTLDIVQVRGKHNRTLIFEPVCRTEDLTEARQQQLREHEAAVELFLAGDMSRARERFRQLHEATPDDPVYPVLLRKTDEAEKAG